MPGELPVAVSHAQWIGTCAGRGGVMARDVEEATGKGQCWMDVEKGV